MLDQINNLIVLVAQLNGNKMNENKLNNESLLNKTRKFFKKNIKPIIIFLISIFFIFIIFQLYNYYTINKIKKNSISFFNIQNFEGINTVEKPLKDLRGEKNFYAVLSKLELIEINIANNNYESAVNLYNELLKDKNLNNIYTSAIASKASFKFIDIGFKGYSKNYLSEINNFISYIDNELINYKGIKLELNYLAKVLEAEYNNIEYKNYNEAVDLYNKILNSDIVSSATKERVTKIHEFHLYN